MPKPLFSIVTVSFNSQETILDTFNSIRNQDYKNIEYIVVDGGSKDKTLEIINENNDIISNWVSEPDKGIYDAMNKGIKMSTGEFVAILNSDDVYYDNNVVSKVVNHFTENNCDIVYGNLNYVEQYNLEKIVRKWRCNEYKEVFLKGWHPAHPSFFVRKKLYENFGFDLDFKIAADFEIMFRFMEIHKMNSSYLNQVLVKMRTGGESNQSLKNIFKR